jgi:hypothetical protein
MDATLNNDQQQTDTEADILISGTKDRKTAKQVLIDNKIDITIEGQPIYYFDKNKELTQIKNKKGLFASIKDGNTEIGYYPIDVCSNVFAIIQPESVLNKVFQSFKQLNEKLNIEFSLDWIDIRMLGSAFSENKTNTVSARYEEVNDTSNFIPGFLYAIFSAKNNLGNFQENVKTKINFRSALMYGFSPAYGLSLKFSTVISKELLKQLDLPERLSEVEISHAFVLDTNTKRNLQFVRRKGPTVVARFSSFADKPDVILNSLIEDIEFFLNKMTTKEVHPTRYIRNLMDKVHTGVNLTTSDMNRLISVIESLYNRYNAFPINETVKLALIYAEALELLAKTKSNKSYWFNNKNKFNVPIEYLQSGYMGVRDLLKEAAKDLFKEAQEHAVRPIRLEMLNDFISSYRPKPKTQPKQQTTQPQSVEPQNNVPENDVIQNNVPPNNVIPVVDFNFTENSEPVDFKPNANKNNDLSTFLVNLTNKQNNKMENGDQLKLF